MWLVTVTLTQLLAPTTKSDHSVMDPDNFCDAILFTYKNVLSLQPRLFSQQIQKHSSFFPGSQCAYRLLLGFCASAALSVLVHSQFLCVLPSFTCTAPHTNSWVGSQYPFVLGGGLLIILTVLLIERCIHIWSQRGCDESSHQYPSA